MKGQNFSHPGTMPVGIKTDILRALRIEISYHRPWKGNELALEEIYGSREEFDSLLPSSMVQLLGVGPAVGKSLVC